MKQLRNNRPQVEQAEETRCTSCGATLEAAHSSNRTWSLESLLPAGMSLRANLCPACRQRGMEHRIGGFVSARV